MVLKIFFIKVLLSFILISLKSVPSPERLVNLIYCGETRVATTLPDIKIESNP